MLAESSNHILDATMPKGHLPRFTIIAAYDKATRGIGFQNKIPWHVPEDMHFSGPRPLKHTTRLGKTRSSWDDAL